MSHSKKRCTIEVPENYSESCSFLVNFSNGVLWPDCSPKFTLYQNEKKPEKKTLVAETNNLVYMGKNCDSERTGTTLPCQYCIGALDKATGVMTLHKAEFITLAPHIPGVLELDVDGQAEEPSAEKADEKESGVDKLVNLFGTQRQKRALSAARKNKVDGDMVAGSIGRAFAHAQDTAEESNTQELAYTSSLAPVHNPAATTPQDLYNINDVVSVEELVILKSTSKVFSEASSSEVAEWTKEGRYPEYVLQHLASLPQEPHRSLKAAILLYISFLIQMYSMSSSAVLKSGLSFDGVSPPAEVLQHITAKFTENQDESKKKHHVMLSERMKDKIFLHLLVLCLFMDDFNVEFLPLQRDLKVSKSKLKDHFRALGCVVKSSKRSRGEPDSPPPEMSAHLKIPPSFPKPKLGKKRKEL